MINLQKLKQTFKGEISVTDADLEKYSHDASIFTVKPQAIVFPKNTEEVCELVKFAAAEKAGNPDLSLTPRSAGTDMGGGAVNESIIMDFTRNFNHLIEVTSTQINTDPPAGGRMNTDEAGYAITEPGVFYHDFEPATLAKNLLLPCYTASKSLNAMGGMVANNSAGEKTLSYGKMEDYVQELWGVLSDGKEYHFIPLTEEQLKQKMAQPDFEGQLYTKLFNLIDANYDAIKQAKPNVSKNSAGYYLWNVWDRQTKIFNIIKLLVGSQGTLGVFTKAKIKLVKPHNHSEMLIIFLKDLKRLGEIVNTVMRYKPETFESFDDHTFSLAVKFLPGLLKKMSAGGGSAFGGKVNILKLGWQFIPEIWMTLTGGLPKLILMAEFTGDKEQEVVEKMRRAQADVEKTYGLKTHVTKNAAEEEKYWTVRRESFNLLRQHVKNMHTAPFVDDIVVHPADLPQFLPELDTIFKKYPSLVYTIAGHAGDANFHIIPLMDFTKGDQRTIIPALSDEVYGLVLKYKGSITAEHNDGLVRGPYLEKMYGPVIFNLFKQVKQIFDPLNIFNPHKKTDATEQYLIDHIRKD